MHLLYPAAGDPATVRREVTDAASIHLRRAQGRTRSLSASDAAIGTQRSPDVPVGAVEVEGLGIEATAAPGQGLPMLGVVGIGDDLEEARITWRATDILRRTGSGTGDTGCGARRGIDGDQVLEGYTVPPVVPEIVDVAEALAWRAAEVAESDCGLVESASIIFEFGLANLLWITVAQTADPELVEMRVPPTKRRLDDPVQLAEMETPRHHELTPDRRLDIQQGDAELHSGRFYPSHDPY